MARHYSSSDYAGLGGENLRAYYGYEKTNEDGEWLFVAEFGENTVQKTAKELGVEKDKWECERVLMAGIAYLFDHYKLI